MSNYPFTKGRNVEPFAERLAGLADLSDEDLDGLEQEMLDAFDAADEAGDVDLMQQLAEGIDLVREEKAGRGGGEEEAAPAEAAPAAAPAVAAATTDTEAPAPVAEVEAPAPAPAPAETPVAEVQPEPEPEAEAAHAEADEPEPTTEEATAESVVEEDTSDEEELKEGAVEVTRDDVPAGNAPEPLPVAAAAQFTITAGGDIPGVTAGSVLSNTDEVIEAMTAKINSQRGHSVMASTSSSHRSVATTSMRPRCCERVIPLATAARSRSS